MEYNYLITFITFCIFSTSLTLNEGVPGQATTIRAKIANPRQKILNRIAVSYNKPEQIHISFGSHANDIVIMWSSTSGEKSYVEYGSNPQAISRVLAQSTELKEHSENAKKFIHRAELKDLSPGIHYTYRIISGLTEIKSKVLSLEVPHNDPKKSHTFMVVADVGLLTKSLQFVVHEALSNKYEAVFHVGDIAYNLDTQGGSRGDQFMNRIQKFTSMVPYMTIPGDHERYFDFYHYRHRFSSPGATWPMKVEELWYSIDIGHAHMISINTQVLGQSNLLQKSQLDWLRKDLIKANQNRQHVPWIIVMGHKPIYCTMTVGGMKCEKEHSEMREQLEDLFFEYGVDLYISGHKHCYERSWPMYKSHALQMNTVDPKGPIYIVIGSMGYEYMFHEQKSSPKWLAVSVTEKGKELFARLKITNRTHLTWSAHVGINNKKVDEMQIIQNKHGSFGRAGQVVLDKLKQKAQYTEAVFTDASSVPSKNTAFNDPVNRQLMLFIGVFSFAFLIFLLMKYFRIQSYCGK